MFNLEESKWEITQSGSLGVNICEFATKGGYLNLKHSETFERIRLVFLGTGLALGTSSFDHKPEQMKKLLSGGAAPPLAPRAKTIYKFPMGGKKLTTDEMGGPFLMLDCGANAAIGGNIFALYLLGKAAAVHAFNPITFPLAIHLAYGAIFSAGLTVTAAAGFTATVTGGYIDVQSIYD